MEQHPIEVKRSSTSKPTRGFHQACQDLNPAKRFLVHSGRDRFPLKDDCEAIGLFEISAILSQLR